MKMKLILACLVFSIAAKAQIGESAFHITWTTVKPTYTDFVSRTSSNGVRTGFTKFINERFGAGLELGYTLLNDYVPRQTYESSGGAITTDVYNYMYHYSLTANGQYYFRKSGLLIPYGSIAAGVAVTEYAIFYNVYSDSDSKTSFIIRPEAGIMYRTNTYSNFGFKAAVGLEYATNKSEYFDLKNFSGVSFQIGILLFNN